MKRVEKHDGGTWRRSGVSLSLPSKVSRLVSRRRRGVSPRCRSRSKERLARDARRPRRRPVRSRRCAFRESGGHDERGRGSTRARDARRRGTTMDEPRTHLVLRELVQLVHLPLVVVPHGPGRARARTASRGAGPSERCRTFGLFFVATPSVYVRNVRVSCFFRLPPHTYRSRFEPLH